METFNIFKNEISFDEDFSKYIILYNKKNMFIDTYIKKYKLFQKNINNMDDLIIYIEDLKKFVVDEYNVIADKIINILVNNQIYDKTIADILSNNQSIKEFNNLVEALKSQIYEYLKNKNSQLESFKQKAAIEAENSYDEYYTNVISSSIWDIIVNDTFNDIEATRVAKKRQRLYDSQVNKAQKILKKEIDNTAKNFQTQLQETIYKASLLIIDEMFIYCFNILALNKKISSSSFDNFQKEKANNILNNIDRIEDVNIKKEQLIVALKSNPFSTDIHSKILYYIKDKDDITEYIKLVKFLNYENTILEICQSKCSDLSNVGNKYIQIINLIDKNYISNILAKANSIESLENENPNKNLSVSKLLFNMSLDKAFDILYYTCNLIGKIQEANKTNGNIIVKCFPNLKTMIIANITTITIKVFKQNQNQTIVEISSLCTNDGIGVLKSAEKWKNKLLEEIDKKNCS